MREMRALSCHGQVAYAAGSDAVPLLCAGATACGGAGSSSGAQAVASFPGACPALEAVLQAERGTELMGESYQLQLGASEAERRSEERQQKAELGHDIKR